MALEQTFSRVNDEKRKMDEDNKARVDCNLTMIANLRNEIDELKGSLNEKKQHNSDLYLELDRQKDLLDHRNVELARLKGDMSA